MWPLQVFHEASMKLCLPATEQYYIVVMTVSLLQCRHGSSSCTSPLLQNQAEIDSLNICNNLPNSSSSAYRWASWTAVVRTDVPAYRWVHAYRWASWTTMTESKGTRTGMHPGKLVLQGFWWQPTPDEKSLYIYIYIYIYIYYRKKTNVWMIIIFIISL